MHPRLVEDRDRLARLLAHAAAYAGETLARLDGARVVARPAELRAVRLPQAGLGAEEALRLFTGSVAPSLAASAGPRYLGFVTGGATPAALIGDWLTTVFDLNPISELDAPAALQLERDTAAMIGELLGLPGEFAGTFTSGATMSNFAGLAVAREWAGREQGVRVSDEGVAALPRITIASATPHSSAIKALSLLGLGRRQWRAVACLPGREAMDVAALEALLQDEPGPCVVIASAGTVNTGDFDDFAALARLKAAHNFWLHVDAAFGGFAAVSPELRPLLEGWVCADSIGVDLHKWLNVPYDSAAVFTRWRDLQVDVFANVSAYLGRSAGDPEPIHRAPENSHRWRALPAWFTLVAYGADGYREIVERDCRLAALLGERIAASPWFELLAPVRLNVVCFAPREPLTSEALVAAVRDGGAAFVTPTVLRGRPAVRAAFSSWRTTEDDLDVIGQALEAAAERLARAR